MGISTGGCGDSGHPGDGEISETIDHLWQAMGVDSEDVTTSPYRRETKRDVTACQDLDEDDRWIAFRTSQLPGDAHPQDRLWDRGTGYLDGNGFEVQRYHDVAGDLFEAYATTDDLAVYLEVQANGYAHLRVVAGPCATRMGYEPLPGLAPID